MAASGARLVEEQTEVGSYFVANYPPFSVWTRDAVNTDARTALAAPPVAGVPLGLYLHIPFCRKRCHFCYFRVYTDKSAREVAQYLDAVAREWDRYLEQPAVAGTYQGFASAGAGFALLLRCSSMCFAARRRPPRAVAKSPGLIPLSKSPMNSKSVVAFCMAFKSAAVYRTLRCGDNVGIGFLSWLKR